MTETLRVFVGRPDASGRDPRWPSLRLLDRHPSMPYNKKMSAAIAYTSVYEKRVGKVLRVEERNAMELHVAETPANSS